MKNERNIEVFVARVAETVSRPAYVQNNCQMHPR